MAMILALFLMTALSALGASLMFLSQTETYASMNYRMMSQGRYAAEAGVQKAANFLFDPNQYTIPRTGGGDDLSNYNRTVSPVRLISNNRPVVLSWDPAQSNYPSGALTPSSVSVVTAFSTAVDGQLAAGNADVTYRAFATLLSMQEFESYGGAPNVVQTWQIVGIGAVVGPRSATVQVSSLVETPKVAANTYAAFATDNGCGALSFNGNINIDSYDSTGLVTTAPPVLLDEGGDVGTNGNLTITGGAASVEGNLYTPRSGVGTCAAGAVTAFTGSSATVGGSIYPLPTTVTFPTPPVPAPSLLPEVTITGGSLIGACASMGLTVLNCDDTGADVRIMGNGPGTSLSLPSVSLAGGAKIVLVAGDPPSEFNFNSIVLAGSSSVGISAASPDQGVLVKVIGQDNLGAPIATPIDFVGGTFASVVDCATCSNFDASMLQFIYSGTGQVRLTGNSGAAATFYAPNADIEFDGSAALYGSVVGRTISNIGGGSIYYDQRLQRDFYVPGHPMAGTFTWTRF
ncbi:MAG: hypothetical protein A3G76_13905 [Acidobacteria bacterium RIFCSPLOWO2_12_FULL_65_11]|nr:MAG: hypothetical protein A3H95_08075 [Acidobacteria bacterium RIFCSPLOWO2_02_FULL_64_15]OFW32569.1 MAG: hypothetical protein A3G76_13905 [Acidobacteria bacterium RIFCSPLOWO2_12_FULL_65_11]